MTHIGKNIKRTLAALATVAAISGAAKADTLSLNLNTPVTNKPAANLLYSGEQFATLNLDSGLSVTTELNSARMGSTDFLDVTQRGKLGNWDIAGSLRTAGEFSVDNKASDVSLYAGKTFGNGTRLNTLQVYSLTDSFRKSGVWVVGKHLDAGVDLKHLGASDYDVQGFAGVHAPTGGVWMSHGSDDSLGLATLVNHAGTRNVAAVGFAKYDIHNEDYIGLVRASTANAPLDGQFSVDGGVGLVRSINLGVHPYLGNASSLHASGGTVAEIGGYRNADGRALWAQAGGPIGYGVHLSAGPMLETSNAGEKHWSAYVEAYRKWQLGDKTSLDVTVRGVEHPLLNVGVSRTF